MVCGDMGQIIGMKDLSEKLIAHCLRLCLGISKSKQPVTIDVYITTLFQIINIYGSRLGIQYFLKQMLTLFEQSVHSFAFEDQPQLCGNCRDHLHESLILRALLI